MENSSLRLSASMQAATEALCENLQTAEPFVLYSLAQRQMNADPQARALLEQLSASQTGIRTAQARGTVTQQDLEDLRAIQSEVQQNPVIMAYARSQQDAINYLREINQEISGLLGVDFATLARNCSSCG